MRRALTAAASALLAACFGCNAILGLNKFEVGGAGGAAGAATGGSSAAGSGGTGAAGSGGAVQCGSKLTPNTKIVRSCVLRTSCLPAAFVPTSSISQCISLNVQEAFGGSACTASAASCSDIQLCDGYGLTSAAQCPTGQTGWGCEGNIAVDCTDHYFVSCDKLGGQCTMYDSNGDFIPDKAGCLVVGSCSEPDGTSSCQNDTLYTCLGGQGYGLVCTNLGGNCLSQGGQPGCYYAAPSCSGQVAPCNGQVAQACVSGQLLRYDCGSVGLSCDAEAGGPYCVAPGCKLANVSACHESCTGSVMHLCYGGAPYDVDCKSFGFSRCVQRTDTSKNGIGDYVACSN